MKKLINYFLLLTLLTTNVACQYKHKNEKTKLVKETTSGFYDLKWKVDKNNPIAYKTAMESIDVNNLAKKGFDCNDFLNAFSDTANFNCEAFKDFFEAMNNLYKDYSFTTTLTEDKNGAIDVKLISVKNNNVSNNLPDSLHDIFANAMTGVQLRGKINKDGAIESFWMKKEQLNLLAIMFELPTKPVKIGDRWTIQASFISNDQNFICDEYKKTHIIELVDVKEIEGDLIAFIKYDIRNYVKGEFNNPFLGKTVPTKMDVGFNGISEFNITKGKWKNYNGLMSMDITGIMTNQTKLRFKLIEIENIPKELLEIK
jgi:hypothetical protein